MNPYYMTVMSKRDLEKINHVEVVRLQKRGQKYEYDEVVINKDKIVKQFRAAMNHGRVLHVFFSSITHSWVVNVDGEVDIKKLAAKGLSCGPFSKGDVICERGYYYRQYDVTPNTKFPRN
jgi:hypothetical protein